MSDDKKARHDSEYKALLALYISLLKAFNGGDKEEALYDLAELRTDYAFRHVLEGLGIDYDEAGTPALDAGREFADYLNTHGISWCAWSLCNKDEVYSVLQPDCSALSNWQDADLTETGRVIFRALRGSET